MNGREAARRARIALIATVFGVIPACAAHSTGSSIPSAEPSASATLPNHGAPDVTDPLRVNAFLPNPCAVLTEAQLNGLNVRATGQKSFDERLGPQCHWDDVTGRTHGSYRVAFVSGEQGLSATYGNRNHTFLQEIPAISGHPAVISMATDIRARGNCSLAVGLNNRQVITVGAVMLLDAPNYTNPCGVAGKITEKIIETIKGAQ